MTQITLDAHGNPTTITDALGRVTTSIYDPLNRLTTLTSPQGTSTFTYDALSRRTTLTLPNGSRATSTYDAASQLTRLLNQGPGASPITIADFAYTHDAVGNRATRTTLQGIAGYDYDFLNRLTQVTDAAGGLTRYTYDPKGNLTAVTDARGQTTTFAYNGVDQLTRTTNPLGQAKTFTYDLARNLTLMVDAQGQRIEFSYDAANQLIQKVLKDPSGTVTDTVTFSCDPLGNLTLAADSDSALTFVGKPAPGCGV